MPVEFQKEIRFDFLEDFCRPHRSNHKYFNITVPYVCDVQYLGLCTVYVSFMKLQNNFRYSWKEVNEVIQGLLAYFFFYICTVHLDIIKIFIFCFFLRQSLVHSLVNKKHFDSYCHCCINLLKPTGHVIHQQV